MIDMLDPRGSEYGGNETLPAGSNFMHSKGLLTHLKPPDVQPAYKKNTVRELLMKRRQTWSCLQDVNSSEHEFKYSESEAFLSYTGPHLPGPPAPVCCIPSSPGNRHIPLQPGQVSLPAGVRLTLFHWQIKQEEQRIRGVCRELLNMQDMDGDTFLHIAVAQGKRALAFVLAAKMAPCGSLELKEHNGQTALHLAAATNQHMIVRDLLSHGAQSNAQDLWGRSPLHVCAEKGHLLCLQSIWKALPCSRQPIDIEIFNYDGLTPLHAAVVSHNAVLKELRNRENTCLNAMMELVQKKHMYVECIKIMLQMGASFGTMDLKSGRTCLHMAAEEANLELFAVFLSQPSSLSIVNAKTFSGNTALHIVSSLQNHQTKVEAMKQLMRHGADPGSRNLENELPSQLVPAGPLGDKLKQILKGKYVHA